MVFPENDYDSSGSFTLSNGEYSFTHRALGADKFRYSANFGQNWTQWNDWENTSTLNATLFADPANFWTGDHVMVQCEYLQLCFKCLTGEDLFNLWLI